MNIGKVGVNNKQQWMYILCCITDASLQRDVTSLHLGGPTVQSRSYNKYSSQQSSHSPMDVMNMHQHGPIDNRYESNIHAPAQPYAHR